MVFEGVPLVEINRRIMESGVVDRSSEAVKGKRKAKKYKDLVTSLVQGMDEAHTAFSQSEDVVDATMVPDNETLIDTDSGLPSFCPSQTTSGTRSSDTTHLPENLSSEMPTIDPCEDRPIDDTGNYNAETLVYVSPETYIYQLNNDPKWGRPSADEINLLDRAFDFAYSDPEQCRNLMPSFLPSLMLSRDLLLTIREIMRSLILSCRIGRGNGGIILNFKGFTGKVGSRLLTLFIIIILSVPILVLPMSFRFGNIY